MTYRDNRIDSMKGFLIILVVLGHVIGVAGSGVLNDRLWKLIFLFHMPMFVMLSGYLTQRKGDIKVFWNKQKSLLLPFLVFQVMSLLIVSCVFKECLTPISFIIPYWSLWYLISLLFWRIFIEYTPSVIINKPFIFLLIAILMALFSGLLHYGRVLSIQRTLNFFPFFLFGYYMGSGLIKKQLWPKALSFTVVLFSIIWLIDILPPPSVMLFNTTEI